MISEEYYKEHYPFYYLCCKNITDLYEGVYEFKCFLEDGKKPKYNVWYNKRIVRVVEKYYKYILDDVIYKGKVFDCLTKEGCRILTGYYKDKTKAMLVKVNTKRYGWQERYCTLFWGEHRDYLKTHKLKICRGKRTFTRRNYINKIFKEEKGYFTKKLIETLLTCCDRTFSNAMSRNIGVSIGSNLQNTLVWFNHWWNPDFKKAGLELFKRYVYLFRRKLRDRYKRIAKPFNGYYYFYTNLENLKDTSILSLLNNNYIQVYQRPIFKVFEECVLLARLGRFVSGCKTFGECIIYRVPMFNGDLFYYNEELPYYFKTAEPCYIVSRNGLLPIDNATDHKQNKIIAALYNSYLFNTRILTEEQHKKYQYKYQYKL